LLNAVWEAIDFLPDNKGVTLAELLIALAIIGVLATFTIPKVLQAQQNAAWKASAKEVAGMIGEGYRKYQLEKGITPSLKPSDLLDSGYINYVKRKTSGLIDRAPGELSVDCANATHNCYVLHNGGVLLVHNFIDFGGSASNYALPFWYDPDGTYSGSATGPGKGIIFYLYLNGRIASNGTIDNPTCDYWGCNSPWQDPDWFSWN
jgi:prepilin-type N-terminal cleavage/methylation domain-containing protein